jgi:Domain of Unknown Function (DUF1259).
MGDTVVFQDEESPAMDAAFASGLEVTALHNHFFYDEPKVYFMHRRTAVSSRIMGNAGATEKLIATGFVESTANAVVSKRFCKRQQMQWTKHGAHLLLQTRVKTLNRELGSMFQRWYPDMRVEEVAEAA